AVVGDGALDVLDRDRRIVHAEHARTFARSRAHAAGEVREVVRLVQPIQRFLPETAINEVVPFRNEVVDRTAARHAADKRTGMAKRNTAIHTARALITEVTFRHMEVKFLPVSDTFLRRTVFR